MNIITPSASIKGLAIASVLALSLAGCKPANDAGQVSAPEAKPATATTAAAQEPATADGASAAAKSLNEEIGKVVDLANKAAAFQGDQERLGIMLSELDEAVVSLIPRLPKDTAKLLQEDLQSIRDAAEAKDWPAAQAAAKSIGTRIEATPAAKAG